MWYEKKKYFLNCFLLMLPVIIWNSILTPLLPALYQPDVFENNIPGWLTYAENTSRILVFLLTLLMPLSLITPAQWKGLFLYVTGLLLYFASWIILLVFPGSTWSMGLLGFSAPAWTPLFWLAGIACLGHSFYFRMRYRKWYFISAALLFLVFHNMHTIMVYFHSR
ncbi:MAG: hypothetical protein KL787_10965 [Taibaiella sp.]|nr:hypothetical protein [Taibaiella sp.]